MLIGIMFKRIPAKIVGGSCNLHSATKPFTPHDSFSLRYQELSVTFKKVFIIRVLRGTSQSARCHMKVLIKAVCRVMGHKLMPHTKK